MNKVIGPAIDASEAIISTNGGEEEDIVIWSGYDTEGYLHDIRMTIWSVWESATITRYNICGVPVPLADGVCRTFAWRQYEVDDDEPGDTVEVEGALDPISLLQNLPDELRDAAKPVVENWYASDYRRLSSDDIDKPDYELTVKCTEWDDDVIIGPIGSEFEVASGAGFGFRDIIFSFANEEDAMDAVSRLEAATIEMDYCWFLEKWIGNEYSELLTISANYRELTGR